MNLPTEWFDSGAGQFKVYWRVDEDCEVQIDNINHGTVFLDSETVAHMAALVGMAKKDHGND